MKRFAMLLLIASLVGCGPTGPSQYEKAKAALEVAERDLKSTTETLDTFEAVLRSQGYPNWTAEDKRHLEMMKQQSEDAKAQYQAALQRMRELSE